MAPKVCENAPSSIIKIRKAFKKWVSGITLATPCTQTGIWLKGQVKPLKIKLGVATTISISVAFSCDGTMMLTKIPIKLTTSTNIPAIIVRGKRLSYSGILNQRVKSQYIIQSPKLIIMYGIILTQINLNIDGHFWTNFLNVPCSNSEANDNAKPNNRTCCKTAAKTPGQRKYI